MTQDEVYQKLRNVFEDVFDEEEIVLAPEVTSADVPGWDSLGHIRLMLAVEKKFKVKFKAAEVSGMKNVGELVGLVVQKTS